ncbi:capsid protein [Passion fruit chlorotic mottle virus]|uniref:Capsid protein n=1 Tax=Passion fruit chlorotic mottle virus TaxID=2162638 RepID=A0A2R4Q8V1_9GEMI|nr:capsid protein [Passion fruit chlorotic mottle virus]AVY03267.1 capsid protein [Passion fruit chlorotic mottle virus]
MVTTRSGRTYGPPTAQTRRRFPPMRRRPAMDRVIGPSKKTVKRMKKGKSGGIPVGCKGPCKTHTVDVIATVTHDGKGPGLVSNISKGDDFGQREGRRIRVTKLLLRGKVWLPQDKATIAGSNIMRLWVMKDRRPGSQHVAFEALFDMADKEPSTALVKMDYRDRFIVIKDMEIDLHGGRDFRVDEETFDIMVPINCDVLFDHNDEGSLTTTLENGIIVYYAVTDPAQVMQLTAQCRLYFFDSTSN